MQQKKCLSKSLDVMESHHFVGRLVAGMKEPVLILDPMLRGSPIVGASTGFLALTGRPLDELLASEVEDLSEGIPSAWLSESSRRNLASFCRECARPGLTAMAEALVVQPQMRKDGSVYVALTVAGFCVVPCPGGLRRVVACAVVPCAEGFQVLKKAREAQLQVMGRAVLSKARAEIDALPCHSTCGERRLPPSFRFFTGRLEGHVIISNAGMTATRRESEELPTGCILFSDRPSPKSREGVSFKVSVSSTTTKFRGLPFLGFTTRRPTAEAGSYTLLSKCLAESVVLGGCGEGFARDQSTHYVMGFKTPPQTEIQRWSMQPGLPPHQRELPAELHPGDEIECRYTWTGRVQYFLNGSVLMDFDTGRPVKEDACYYAVVDVCFTATSLTLVPLQSDLKANLRVQMQSTTEPTDYREGDVSTFCNTLEHKSSCSSSICSDEDEDNESQKTSTQNSLRSGISVEQIIMRQYGCAVFGVGLVESFQSLPSLTMDSLPPLAEGGHEC